MIKISGGHVVGAGHRSGSHCHPPDFRSPRSAERVFITENEINFLAFPFFPKSLVIFGAGYGFEKLAQAHWLHRCRINSWGDLDTHGFAILDQLRAYFPAAVSFLMDRATLLAHRRHRGKEAQPEKLDLHRLICEEYTHL